MCDTMPLCCILYLPYYLACTSLSHAGLFLIFFRFQHSSISDIPYVYFIECSCHLFFVMFTSVRLLSSVSSVCSVSSASSVFNVLRRSSNRWLVFLFFTLSPCGGEAPPGPPYIFQTRCTFLPNDLNVGITGMASVGIL